MTSDSDDEICSEVLHKAQNFSEKEADYYLITPENKKTVCKAYVKLIDPKHNYSLYGQVDSGSEKNVITQGYLDVLKGYQEVAFPVDITMFCYGTGNILATKLVQIFLKFLYSWHVFRINFLVNPTLDTRNAIIGQELCRDVSLDTDFGTINVGRCIAIQNILKPRKGDIQTPLFANTAIRNDAHKAMLFSRASVPYIEANISGIIVKTLVDTGAVMSTLELSFVYHLGLFDNMIQAQSSLAGAIGEVNIVGFIDLAVQLTAANGMVTDYFHRFHVVENSGETVSLGLPWFLESNLVHSNSEHGMLNSDAQLVVVYSYPRDLPIRRRKQPTLSTKTLTPVHKPFGTVHMRSTNLLSPPMPLDKSEISSTDETPSDDIIIPSTDSKPPVHPSKSTWHAESPIETDMNSVQNIYPTDTLMDYFSTDNLEVLHNSNSLKTALHLFDNDPLDVVKDGPPPKVPNKPCLYCSDTKCPVNILRNSEYCEIFDLKLVGNIFTDGCWKCNLPGCEANRAKKRFHEFHPEIFADTRNNIFSRTTSILKSGKIPFLDKTVNFKKFKALCGSTITALADMKHLLQKVDKSSPDCVVPDLSAKSDSRVRSEQSHVVISDNPVVATSDNPVVGISDSPVAAEQLHGVTVVSPVLAEHSHFVTSDNPAAATSDSHVAAISDNPVVQDCLETLLDDAYEPQPSTSSDVIDPPSWSFSYQSCIYPPPALSPLERLYTPETVSPDVSLLYCPIDVSYPSELDTASNFGR